MFTYDAVGAPLGFTVLAYALLWKNHMLGAPERLDGGRATPPAPTAARGTGVPGCWSHARLWPQRWPATRGPRRVRPPDAPRSFMVTPGLAAWPALARSAGPAGLATAGRTSRTDRTGLASVARGGALNLGRGWPIGSRDPRRHDPGHQAFQSSGGGRVLRGDLPVPDRGDDLQPRRLQRGGVLHRAPEVAARGGPDPRDLAGCDPAGGRVFRRGRGGHGGVRRAAGPAAAGRPREPGREPGRPSPGSSGPWP